MWTELVALPLAVRILLVMFVLVFFVLGPGLASWTLYRLLCGRNDIRASLTQDGFRVRELELRWFTRGPFRDMRLPGSLNNRGEYLFRIAADDRGSQPRTGWIRWRARWPWQSAEDPWAVVWDDYPQVQAKGLSAVQFYALVLLLIPIVLSLISVAWRQVLA